MNYFSTKPLTWFVTAAICAIWSSSPAMAATIGINNRILTATATAGDDVLLGILDGPDLALFGVFFTIVTPGCIDNGFVACALTGFDEMRIMMGDGDDVVLLGDIPPTGILGVPAIKFIVLGGDGGDVLVGTKGEEMIYGGAGDDVILGGGGLLSCADGGPGDDILVDVLCGGPPEPDFPPAHPDPVPEPSAFGLLLAGLGTIALSRRWRR